MGVVAGYVTAGRDNRWIVMERVTAVPLEAGPKQAEHECNFAKTRGPWLSRFSLSFPPSPHP